MARAKSNNSGGEGKTPLVIGLVFFVLATIILGVLAYTFQGENAAAEAKAAESKKDTELARSEQSKVEDRLRLYRVLIGQGEEEDRAKLSASPNKEFLRDEHTKIMARINTKLQSVIDAEEGNFVGAPGDKKPKPSELFSWPWPNQGEMLAAPSPGPLVDALVKYRSESATAMRKVTNNTKSAIAESAALKASMKTYDDDKQKYATQTQAIPAKIAAIEAGLKADVDKTRKDFTDASGDYKGKIKETRDLLENTIRQAAEDKDKLNNVEGQRDRALSELGKKKKNLFASDKPKGMVTATFTGGDNVEINLGSADRVAPGLTFSVLEAEAKEAGPKIRKKIDVDTGRSILDPKGDFIFDDETPKAMVTVIETLGPNLSRARVTFRYDRNRDPILKGDLLYNIAWHKGNVDHVVLYGIFDTDGDGSDDIKTLARALDKMGIVVDGYYDLAARKWIGGGPTSTTIFAVEGAIPSASAGDGLLKEKGELVASILAAADEATKKGAKPVSYREFFARIGYAAKSDVSVTKINQAASRYLPIPTAVVPEGQPK